MDCDFTTDFASNQCLRGQIQRHSNGSRLLPQSKNPETSDLNPEHHLNHASFGTNGGFGAVTGEYADVITEWQDLVPDP